MNLEEEVSLEFPYKDKIYLNSASTSRMPKRSISSMVEFLETYNKLGPDSESSVNYVNDLLSKLRREISLLIKCQPEEVVFTQSVTDGINFVSRGFQFKPNANIIIRGSSHEHPANHYPWIREGKHAKLTNLDIDENGFFDIKDLDNAIDMDTGLVALSHALFNTGAILPVNEVGEILQTKGIPYFIDAAQTVGCIKETDVNKMRCNFMSFNGSKWLCGPMGTGIFFCKKDSSQLLDPLQIGGESAIFHENKIIYKEIPDKFQAGFRNWSGLAGLETSVNYLLGIGIDNIRYQAIKLANLLRDELSKLSSVIIYGPQQEERRTSIVSFSFKNKESQWVVKELEKQGIILAVREIFSKKVIRASPHFFNTESEILGVIEAIKKI